MNNINISDEKLSFYKSAFDNFDKDKDGYINLSFIIDLMKSVKIDISQEDSSIFISEFDIEKNGKISFQEFILFILRKVRDGPDGEIENFKELYGLLTNGSNNLTKEKLKMVMNGISDKMGLLEKITDEEINQMLMEANNNEESGELSCDDFIKMINRVYK